ncbi:MAG: class I SAM-dependent methyltransferase [Flavobacteriaceae bacterium]
MTSPLGREIAAAVARDGPMRLDRYMARCLDRYYAAGTAIGAAGDFTTAPEVSQMFGEIVGAWALHVWETMGAPSSVRLVELGPGRGTLAADMMRIARLRPAFAAGLTLHLVERSPGMREAQRRALAAHDRVFWHDDFTTVPEGPAIIVANEFFDALPVRQFVRRNGSWRERAVGIDGGALALAETEAADPPPFEAEDGAIAERHEAGAVLAGNIGARIAGGRGACLIVDYGYAGPAFGDSLQAMRGHGFADPLADPGEADLTAHVDFAQLLGAARAAGARVAGPMGQGAFLGALGIGLRAERLAAANPARRAAIEADLARLASPDAMGALFKAAVIHDAATPLPPPFAAAK